MSFRKNSMRDSKYKEQLYFQYLFTYLGSFPKDHCTVKLIAEKLAELKKERLIKMWKIDAKTAKETKVERSNVK